MIKTLKAQFKDWAFYSIQLPISVVTSCFLTSLFLTTTKSTPSSNCPSKILRFIHLLFHKEAFTDLMIKQQHEDLLV